MGDERIIGSPVRRIGTGIPILTGDLSDRHAHADLDLICHARLSNIAIELGLSHEASSRNIAFKGDIICDLPGLRLFFG